MSLERLFLKYKCDKYFHKYHLVYEKFFLKIKNNKLKILEIGVSDGASLRSWSDYFKKSEIIGFDVKSINPKKIKKFKKKHSYL